MYLIVYLYISDIKYLCYILLEVIIMALERHREPFTGLQAYRVYGIHVVIVLAKM
jgi:hypothetical protein